MISKELLTNITYGILIILAIAALVLIIFGIIKRKNTLFAISQVIYAGAFLCVLTIGFYGGITCEYTGGTEHNVVNFESEVKKLDDYRTYREYTVQTEDGKEFKTSNIIYGEDYKYIDNCKVVKTTAFPFKVYSTDTLLICKPDNENFDELSESNKRSILKKLNKGVILNN